MIILLISLCMFLPYLPGDYDNLSPILSFLAQLLCFTGLILVPVGIVWLIYEITRDRTKASNGSYYFSVAALITLCIVVLFVLVAVYFNWNRSLALIAMALFIYFSLKIKGIKKRVIPYFNPIPFYLIFIPLTLLLIRFLFIHQAVAYSRDRAIRKSAQLIQDIETYHKNNGHYPPSMLSVVKDYKTSVTGMKQYHYELNGNAYNLYFEQVAADPSAKEIVMYNKLDEHVMTSHDEDLLLLSAGALAQQRGYFAVHDLPVPHWKYFWFD